MKVYVLLHGYPYEGADIVAVYANEDTANQEQVRRSATANYDYYEVVEHELIED